MSEKLMRNMAVNSLCFFVLLCLLSTIFVTPEGSSLAGATADLPDTAPQDLFPVQTVTGSDESSVSEEPSDTASFDASKLGEVYIQLDISHIQHETITLKEDGTNRKLTLMIDGLSRQEIAPKDIERIYRNDYRYGKVRKKDKKDLLESLHITYGYNPSDFSYTAKIQLVTKNVYVPTLMVGSTYCYIVLQKPREVYDKIVVIDAGHGGNDTGTYSQDLSCIEPTYTLAIAMELKKLLDKSDIKAYYTRTADIDVSKKFRVDLTNKLDADFLISIHCNGAIGIDLNANGMEALYAGDALNSANKNRLLAETCLKEMTDATGRKNRGIIHRDDLYLLNHSKVPATILEVGFMSNTQDMNYLNKRANLRQIAIGIYNGIQKAYTQDIQGEKNA